MATKLKTIAPVDSLSGMFGSRKNNLSDTAIIANVHKKGGAKNDGKPFMNFSTRVNNRSPKFSQDELARQERFGAISVATKNRLMDPNHLAEDQVNFAKQTKYKTLRQYVWHVCADIYDEENA